MINTPLTAQRKGEIALAFLKFRIKKEGIHLSKDTKREIANTAKELGIPLAEAEMFAEEIVRDLVESMFPAKK